MKCQVCKVEGIKVFDYGYDDVYDIRCPSCKACLSEFNIEKEERK